MRFIDLFAGIGGFRYGLEKANKNVNAKNKLYNRRKLLQRNNNRTVLQETQKTTCTCVYSNEFNKYANSVYRRHYGKCDQRDIRKVQASEIPDHDLLCSGFPCQSFSIAGKRGGFKDTRGTLFFEIARILQQKQPSYCLLENVKGLLSHQNGRTFQTILTTLDELGYDLQWQVLNSKNFGVLQNRERVFIIGHLRRKRRPKVFPIRRKTPATLEKIIDGSQGMRVYKTKLSTTVSARGGGWGAKTGLYQINIGDDFKIRRLTPLECERLQGYPENWTKYGLDGEKISDTQRYRQLGNAVTTTVVEAIGEKLIETTTN